LINFKPTMITFVSLPVAVERISSTVAVGALILVRLPVPKSPRGLLGSVIKHSAQLSSATVTSR
jgi:hypothetical protein